MPRPSDEIRPIRDEAGYEAALLRVEALFGALAGTRELDELDLLTTLIEAYEAKHHPIDPPTPIEAIEFRMDQMGIDRKDLEELVGLSRARISEVLNRRRPLSIAMIRAFHTKLGIPAEVLVRDYPLAKHARRTTRAAKTSRTRRRR